MLDKSFKLKNDVLIDELEDEQVLFNSKTAEFYQVNPIGALILSKPDAETRVRDAIKTIQEKFPQVEKEQVEKDVLEFLEGLEKEALIELK